MPNHINTPTEDTSIEDLDEDYLENRTKRSMSVSSGSIRKRRKISAHENAANTAARSMEFLATRIVEAQQISVTPQQTRFDQCMEILNEMETEEKISSDDYFRICQAFMKGSENYSALFAGMKPDLRVKWLIKEKLLNVD